MSRDQTTPITELLARWRHGDREAENALVEAVYPVLRDLARSRLRRHPNELTWQATELANEAYLRLAKAEGRDWENRTHFFAIAAKVMRGLVVDHARARDADKRGGGIPFVSLDRIDAQDGAALDLGVDWLAVHEALNELEAKDALAARVVELRVFVGLSVEEIAEACASSTATIGRHWRFARVWLAQRLGA